MDAEQKSGDHIQIREVWDSNLEFEFALIQEIVDKYPYVAMDIEFPGIVLCPIGSFKTNSEYNYETLKMNVDLLKLIQLGLTFSEEGNLPICEEGRPCIWQFNFREFKHPRRRLCQRFHLASPLIRHRIHEEHRKRDQFFAFCRAFDVVRDRAQL